MSEIVIEHLSKTFTTKDGTVEALKDISLSIESGDIFGIIGMSGAGKSTLVRCMNYLEEPSRVGSSSTERPSATFPSRNCGSREETSA